MKNEQMLKLSYETDIMPAGDQIYCYLSCNVRINKGELKKRKKMSHHAHHCVLVKPCEHHPALLIYHAITPLSDHAY